MGKLSSSFEASSRPDCSAPAHPEQRLPAMSGISVGRETSRRSLCSGSPTAAKVDPSKTLHTQPGWDTPQHSSSSVSCSNSKVETKETASGKESGVLRGSTRVNSPASLPPQTPRSDPHSRLRGFPPVGARQTIGKTSSTGSPGSISPSPRRKRGRRSTSWTPEEDEKLRGLVDEEAKAPPSITVVKTWSRIAARLPGRTGKQCRERWLNQLQPGIKRDPWSEEEERILHEAHAKLGNKWVEISKELPGRTDNCVKNHWNSMIRKRQRRLESARLLAQRALRTTPVLKKARKSVFIPPTVCCASPSSTVTQVTGTPPSGHALGTAPALVALATAASSVPPSPLTPDSRGSLSPLPHELRDQNGAGRAQTSNRCGR